MGWPRPVTRLACRAIHSLRTVHRLHRAAPGAPERDRRYRHDPASASTGPPQVSGAQSLTVMARCIEDFADGLVAHAGRLGTLAAQTHWQSMAAAQFQQRLVQLRVDLRAGALAARDGAERVRRAAAADAGPG